MVSRLLALLLFVVATPALAADALDVAAGHALFRRSWVTSPASLRADAGLGPLYDARSCESCHGGGSAGRVARDALGAGLLIRVGRRDGGGDPVYGRQLQARSVPGLEPEAEVNIRWSERGGKRVAKLDIARLHDGPLGPGTHAALRRAPSLSGLGVLASVSDAEILSRTAEHDGISGRASWVRDAKGGHVLGRWGWKAASGDLTDQVETAFQRDFGISTSGRPGAYAECTVAETLCRRAAQGPKVELPDDLRDLIVGYVSSLPPPAPRDETGAGFALFRKAGCLACHAILNSATGTVVPAYTDLLLHDLGPGLDDGIAEGGAKSFEWRTAPLWDVADNLARGGLLHDGRARSVAEAVLWHGGEASRARAAFNRLSSNDRKMLEDFLLEP